MTPGIAVGELCPSCRKTVARKAARIGRLAAIATTLPLAVYVAMSLPLDRTARLVAAVAVVVWYLLCYRIAKRIAQEWLK